MISHFFDKHGAALRGVKNIEREEDAACSQALASFHLKPSWMFCVFLVNTVLCNM